MRIVRGHRSYLGVMAALAVGLGLIGSGVASAQNASTDYTLEDNGQSATFNTQDGLTSWNIGDTSLLNNQQYFIRLDGKESNNGPTPSLNTVSHPEIPLGNFFESAEQKAPNKVKAHYDIDGGNMSEVFNNNNEVNGGGLKAWAKYKLNAVNPVESHIKESLEIKSKGYEGKLSVFVYTDLDLDGFSGDTGTASRNGAQQFDNGILARYLDPKASVFKKKILKPLGSKGKGKGGGKGGDVGNGEYEWVKKYSKNPDRYDIAPFPEILDLLEDGDADDLPFTSGSQTVGPADVTFAHQFDFYVKKGQKIRITGKKAAVVPTPSAIGGGLVLLSGLALRRRRRRALQSS